MDSYQYESMTISTELLQRFDIAGPRYTSYPTADRFVEAFGESQYQDALSQRRHSARSHAFALSVYVHIPFCTSLCYYCACNKIITHQYAKALSYLESLGQELALLSPYLGEGNKVSQLHLGGGTPTYLRDPELRSLMKMLGETFSWQEGGEYSIEVDPRTVDSYRLGTLRELGFNRLSLGVQDFDPAVQQAVHREQSFLQVETLMRHAAIIGFSSVNLDLIYGLPKQTQSSWAQTMQSVVQLHPERIALYAYAHLPARFKPQRLILADDIPSAEMKTDMLSMALEQLQAAGYVYIGMDHFALPQDALAIAKRQGRLHRNFQGYTTQPDCDLIGLGMSAIGNIGATYQQNMKSLADYQDTLAQGRLPVERGIALSRDDLLRRHVIMAIMCQGSVSYESVELSHLINFKHYFRAELELLADIQAQGLVKLNGVSLEVTADGWFVVRAIAMVFDRYLQHDQHRTRFSKII
jgi:oxygen-independent coproporphyrinogen-3 oxidase